MRRYDIDLIAHVHVTVAANTPEHARSLARDHVDRMIDGGRFHADEFVVHKTSPGATLPESGYEKD